MIKIITDLEKKKQNDEIPKGYKTSEGYLIPKEWNLVQFKSLFNRLTRKNKEDNQNVLTISAQQGLISQMDYYNTLYASENKLGYSLLYKGDFAYNKSYSGDYAYGVIKRLEAYDKGIVSPLYICFEPQKGTNSEFYKQYFESGIFNREIYKIAEEGARNHGLLNVSTEDFFGLVLVAPSLEEQERIAEILLQCDKVIKLKEERIEEEQKKKKWLLKKLLNPCSCSKIMKSNKEWQTKQIGDIATLFSGGTPKSSEKRYYANNEIPFIRSGEIGQDHTELFISKLGLEESSAKMVEVGDLLYALYGANSGECAISKINGAINQAILCIRSNQINTNFLFYILVQKKDIIVSKYLQGGQGNLSAEIIKKVEIQFPPKNVQIEIVDTLSIQDRKISLLMQEVECWKQKKKALMQLLFTGIVRVKV